MQETMQKILELQKVSCGQSIQEVKEQVYGALDAVDDLKERTKSMEEAAMNITIKNDEHSGNRPAGEQNGRNDRQTWWQNRHTGIIFKTGQPGCWKHWAGKLQILRKEDLGLL